MCQLARPWPFTHFPNPSSSSPSPSCLFFLSLLCSLGCHHLSLSLNALLVFMTHLPVFITLLLPQCCFNCQLCRPLLSLVTPHSLNMAPFSCTLSRPCFITAVRPRCALNSLSVPGPWTLPTFTHLTFPPSLFPQMWPPQSRRSSSSRSYDSAAFFSTSCLTHWATWNGRKSSGRRWAKWWSTSPTTGMSSQSPSTPRWCTWSVELEGFKFVVQAEDAGETENRGRLWLKERARRSWEHII